MSESSVSHPDKVLFPKAGIAKADLVRYYEKTGKIMLKSIKGRALTLRCFPGGVDGKGFFLKRVPDHFPESITRVSVPTVDPDKPDAQMPAVEDVGGLIDLVGQNAVEIHTMLCPGSTLDKPDQIIFDFDPSDDDFQKVRQVAVAFDKMLEAQDIPAFWKTTGSRGLHVHIPIAPRWQFETLRDWAKDFAARFHEKHPQRTTLEQRKAKRGSKVFIDYLRNAYGQTAIAPYSPRARSRATVATPIRRDELRSKRLCPDRYHIGNLQRRMSQMSDPWEDFDQTRLKNPDWLGLD